jgi:hypothetical protein
MIYVYHNNDETFGVLDVKEIDKMFKLFQIYGHITLQKRYTNIKPEDDEKYGNDFGEYLNRMYLRIGINILSMDYLYLHNITLETRQRVVDLIKQHNELYEKWCKHETDSRDLSKVFGY